jgi:hypothetical protein
VVSRRAWPTAAKEEEEEEEEEEGKETWRFFFVRIGIEEVIWG